MDDTATRLAKQWIWSEGFIDFPLPSAPCSAGRLISFTRSVDLPNRPERAILYCSADTRYKLLINSSRVTVGPTRGCEKIWYYDTVDISPYLRPGQNTVEFVVWRVYPASYAAAPFERTAWPGLTALGEIECGGSQVSLQTDTGWTARELPGVRFPTDSKGDGFLNIFERIGENDNQYYGPEVKTVAFPFPRSWKTQGELPSRRLRPRLIPLPEETPVGVHVIRRCESTQDTSAWTNFFKGGKQVDLPAGSKHYLEVQADCHSTAFLRFRFGRAAPGTKIRVTYSESYERPPLDIYDSRNKGDRLDSTNAVLTGSCVDYYDEIDLSSLPLIDAVATYEPFWFRTFRFLAIHITVGSSPLTIHSFEAKQTNYPLEPKAQWVEVGKDGAFHDAVWEVSIRTLRNCMFDGYSDCPFYEQLQYAQDSRSSGLFHYLLSGDDRLMRQAIQGFAASATADGLIEARYPSHVHQIISGFCLFWILELKDNLLYFNDPKFIEGILPLTDRILTFFERHRDHRGLVSGLPGGYWSYVDWAKEWVSTEDHPDGGVPFAGRKTNTHTIFSLVYAYVLGETATMLKWLGKDGTNYIARKESLLQAIREHCFNGTVFTDTTADACTGQHDLSQHTQVMAVLSGAADAAQSKSILRLAFGPSSGDFVQASYAYTHYSLRAFSVADVYEEMWTRTWEPYRTMLRNNLSTWEEDNVRHRSDCHAWGSLALYEFPIEVAGVSPLSPGWQKTLWRPRIQLSEGLKAIIPMGDQNTARVEWSIKTGIATLELKKPCDILFRGESARGLIETSWTAVRRLIAKFERVDDSWVCLDCSGE